MSAAFFESLVLDCNRFCFIKSNATRPGKQGEVSKDIVVSSVIEYTFFLNSSVKHGRRALKGLAKWMAIDSPTDITC